MSKLTVSALAMEGRIRRAIEKEQGPYIVLKKNRLATRTYHDLGRYYILDLKRNAIKRMHVDLETLAQEMNVLAPYEELGE